MLSFLQWILIYTLLESIILIMLINISKQELQISNNLQKIRKRIYLMFLVGLLIYIVPQGLKLFPSKYSYPNPDTYSYVLSVEKSIPWDKMPIDPYYRGFPIYIIWGKTLSLVSASDAHNAFVVLHIISSLLIPILILIILRTFDPRVNTKQIFLLLYPLIPVTSIYLYSYMMIMIPQSIGVTLLLFLLTLTFKHVKRVEEILIFSIFALISLVHFGIIPTYILVLLTTISSLKILQEHVKQMRSRVLLILPLLMHMIYIAYVYNPANLRIYIDYYIQLLISLFTQPGKVLGTITTTETTGFARSYPYINAFGPALFLSLTLVGMYLTIRKLLRINAALHSTIIVGVLFLALGVSRLYFATWIPSGSVARYVNVYGFALISIFNTYILAQLVNRDFKYIKTVLIILFALGVVGAYLDPFTFTHGFTQTDTLTNIAKLLSENITVNFVSSKDLYYIGPALSMWVQLYDKNANIASSHLSLTIETVSKVLSSETIEMLYSWEKKAFILLSKHT